MNEFEFLPDSSVMTLEAALASNDPQIIGQALGNLEQTIKQLRELMENPSLSEPYKTIFKSLTEREFFKHDSQEKSSEMPHSSWPFVDDSRLRSEIAISSSAATLRELSDLLNQEHAARIEAKKSAARESKRANRIAIVALVVTIISSLFSIIQSIITLL